MSRNGLETNGRYPMAELRGLSLIVDPWSPDYGMRAGPGSDSGGSIGKAAAIEQNLGAEGAAGGGVSKDLEPIGPFLVDIASPS